MGKNQGLRHFPLNVLPNYQLFKIMWNRAIIDGDINFLFKRRGNGLFDISRRPFDICCHIVRRQKKSSFWAQRFNFDIMLSATKSSLRLNPILFSFWYLINDFYPQINELVVPFLKPKNARHRIRSKVETLLMETSSVKCTPNVYRSLYWMCSPLHFLWHGLKQFCNAFSCKACFSCFHAY